MTPGQGFPALLYTGPSQELLEVDSGEWGALASAFGVPLLPAVLRVLKDENHWLRH